MQVVKVTLAASRGRPGTEAYEVRFDDGKLAPIHTRGEMAPTFDVQGVATSGHSYFATEEQAARYALAVSETSRKINRRLHGTSEV